MVDPISIAVAGISTLGGIAIGKFSRRGKDKENVFNFEVPPAPENRTLFVALKEMVEPDKIFDLVYEGHSIFLNTKEIQGDNPFRVEKYKEYLESLVQKGKERQCKINQVASELLLVSDLEHEIKVETLKNGVTIPRKLELEDLKAS